MPSDNDLELKKKQINSMLNYLLSHLEFTELDQEDHPDSVKSYVINEYPEQTLAYYKCIYDNFQSRPVGQHRSQAIWRELYSFFELDYLEQVDVDSHLEQARQSIPSILTSIQKLSFDHINSKMNQHIGMFVKGFKYYSYLFTDQDYIDQMRNIYMEVEDALSRIEYVESLYPSRRLLIESHPYYASPEFDSVHRTLILWHKIMRELMEKCNQLGQLFGFQSSKYRKFWSWFDDYLIDSQLSNHSNEFKLNHESCENRLACFKECVKSKKLCYRSLFSDIGHQFGCIIVRSVQVLQTNKCYLDTMPCNEYNSQICQESEHFYYHMLPLHPRLRFYLTAAEKREDVEERVEYGVNSETFRQLGLSSFRPLLMYLLNNIIEIVQICIQVYLDNNRNVKIRTDIKFNLLCIEAYVKEASELIEDTILIRQMVYHSMRSVFEKHELNRDYNLESYFLDLDKLLKEQIRAYLNFIRLWCEELIKIGNYDKVLEILNNEWTFCKKTFHYVTCSEDLHVEAFSYILSILNRSMLAEIQRIDRECKEPLMKYVREEIIGSTLDQKALKEKLFDVNLMCSSFKSGLKRLEHVFDIDVKFCDRFFKGIEKVSKYQVMSSVQKLLDNMADKNYTRVAFNVLCKSQAIELDHKFMIFIPMEYIKEKIQIVRLLFIHNEIDNRQYDEYVIREAKENLASSYTVDAPLITNGYLLYLQLPNKEDMIEEFEWKGRTIRLNATQPVSSSLRGKNAYKLNTPELILLADKQSVLAERRKELESKLGNECLNLCQECTLFHLNSNIETAINNIKEVIVQVRKEAIQLVTRTETDLMTLLDSYQSSRLAKIGDRDLGEILRLCFVHVCRLGFTLCLRYEVSFIEHVAKNLSVQVTPSLAELFILFINFFTYRGEMQIAVKLIKIMRENLHLFSDSECRGVGKVIDSLFFVITFRILAILKMAQLQERREFYFCKKNSRQALPARDRFELECARIDLQRRSVLFDKRYIGKVLESERSDYIIQPSEVSFRWQAGIQIGKGRFGIVYSCVNLDTGAMMALKIIYLHKIMKKKESEKVDAIADEINNVLKIEHPNLVKMIGAELNRTSIYIFMEYCGINCTLEKLCKQTSGLSEELVRSYTNQLLRAVEALHDKQIIHRDIKPQNIFLKEIDPDNPKYLLKLGDFGCSFNFNNANETFKANEIVGTPYYMAPEVILSESLDDCYSYSADIWSVGCVVIEMWTGTRPWYPLEPFQISMKLCLDQTSKPQYPTEIKSEAIKFLDRCIQYEPVHRDTAEQLLGHSFLKISM